MGLDNGIIIKAKTIKAAEFLKEQFPDLEDKYSSVSYTFEFDYWRKQWGMRERALRVFEKKYDNDEYEISMNFLDLYTYVEKVLKFFLNENNYDNYKGNTWEWFYFITSIAEGIRNITLFLKLVEEYEMSESEFEIYWYDSY